jgi:hypothetical protein
VNIAAGVRSLFLKEFVSALFLMLSVFVFAMESLQYVRWVG